MNRFQKKCIIASTGLHLLLALVLLVGPAFLSSSSKQNSPPKIDFIPVAVVEGALSGGGNPQAQMAPPALPPTPAPQPPAAQNPTPVVTPPTPPPQPQRDVAPPRRDPPTPAPQRQAIVPNLTPTVRNPNQTSTPRPRNTPTRDSNDEARRNAADQIRQAASSIHSGLSGSTSIELRGPGGGGLPYAGFEQAILAIYDQAWIAPEGMDASEAVVAVRVTIEPDGRISASRIIQRSGDSRVDRSVQEALDRVTRVPVPDDMKSSRTVEFDFKSRSKQNI